MTDDILDRAAELDRRILAIPEDQVFTKRRVTRFGVVVLGLLFLLVGLAVANTFSTRQAVTHEIPGLKHQIEQRDKTIADQQNVINQVPPIVQRLSQQIIELGGDPGQVVLCVRDKNGECK